MTDYTDEVGSTMLVFSVSFGVIILREQFSILISIIEEDVIQSFLFHFLLVLSKIKIKMGSGFPPSFGQIPPTSGYSDWPNRMYIKRCTCP